jgi:Zn-dependent protease with chaperone function
MKKEIIEINKNKILCFYSIIFNKIYVSNGFLKKLNENEILFMISHEECHKNDRIKYLIFIILFISSLILLLLSITISIMFIVYLEFLFVFFLFTVIFFIFMIFFYRLSEYRADEYAAKKVDYKYFFSSLEKFKNEEYSIFENIIAKMMHPSPEKRIKKILEKNK